MQIRSCKSNGALIKILFSENVVIKDVSVVDSPATVLDVTKSFMNLANLFIENTDRSLDSVFLINIDKKSKLLLESFSVTSYSSSLLYMQDSQLIINGSSIDTLSADTQEPFIYAVNSIFQLITSQILLKSKPFIVSQKSGLNFKQVNFTRKYDSSMALSASLLKCVDCVYVVVEGSVFDGKNAYCRSGAALNLISEAQTSNVTIVNSLFINNLALEEGGAIYVENCNLTIHNSTFSDNKADTGGAIYSQIKVDSQKNLNIFNSEFSNNNANTEGGALKYTFQEPNLNQVVFKNNFAKVYGNDIAAFPVRITADLLSSKNEEIQLNENTSALFTMKNESTGLKLSYGIVFSLVDKYGATVKTVSRKLAQVVIFNKSNETTSEIKGDVSLTIEEGVFSPENLIIYAEPPNTTLTLAISTPEINRSLSEYYIGSMLNPNEIYLKSEYALTIPVALRNCLRGEIYSKDIKACKKCEYGKYSLNPNNSECLPCPLNTKCEGGDAIILDRGFWRSSTNSTNIYKCDPYLDACLGGYNSECKIGHVGTLCQACLVTDSNKYFRSGVYNCEKCEISTAQSVFQAIAILSTILIILSILISANLSDMKQLSKYSLTDEESPEYILKNKRILNKVCQSIILKIFVNYCQVISIARTLNLNWPEEVAAIFKVHEGGGGVGQLADNISSI